MISYTPVANPVVPQQGESEAPSEHRSELRAPVLVMTRLGDIELSQGSLLIGRLPECDLRLTDALVSRMHARISVQDGRVVLEDLHSTNGVFVNGHRVGYSVVLCEGDRILVGTSELSLFRCADSTVRPPPFPRSEVNAKPPSEGPSSPSSDLRATRMERFSGKRLPSGPSSSSALQPTPASPELLSTSRADALRMLGEVAERLAAVGNLDEAATLLAGQLRRILRGANSGLPVPPEMVDSASIYALKLARWTKRHLWADYVVELHLSAKRLMNLAVLQAYEVAILQLDFDRLLLAYYVESLKHQLPRMIPAERIRVEHLASLLDKGS